MWLTDRRWTADTIGGDPDDRQYDGRHTLDQDPDSHRAWLWGFGPPKASQVGFWAMAHEARTDFCMFLGSIFLLIVGAGSLSLDAMIARSRRTTEG